MSADFIINRLKKKFKNREAFSREELFDFYKTFEPDLKETTFRWRIYHLKEKKIIRAISKSEFSLSYKPVYKPQIGELERKVYVKMEKGFPSLKASIWSTKVLNEFMLHLPGKFITVLEVEKEAMESVFRYLQDSNIQNVYLQPEEREIERYIFEQEEAIIIKPLISRSPVQKVNKIKVPCIEKIIVDLYCDRKLFNLFQGSEFVHIVNNIDNRYVVDFTKLFSYAKRRNKEAEIMEFLSHETNIRKSVLE